MFSKLKPLSKRRVKNQSMQRLNTMLERYKPVLAPVDVLEYDADFDLFRQAVEGVTPLVDDHIIFSPPKPKPRVGRFPEPRFEKAIFSESTEWLNLECPQQLSWVKHGYDPNLVKRLRTGRCILNDQIDLHGHTVANASRILQSILSMMSHDRLKYLLIIHGKGNHLNSTGVVKAKVNEWLRIHPHVIAFASAPLKWGDTGATVVMLGAFND